MKRKLYTISGIPLSMLKSGLRDFRRDIQLTSQKGSCVTGRIALTRFEAFIMRIQMIMYNLTHPCLLKLTKLGGKRFRV